MSPTGCGVPVLPLVRTRRRGRPCRARRAAAGRPRSGSARRGRRGRPPAPRRRSPPPLGLGEPRASGSSTAPTFISAWISTTCSRPGMHGQRGGRAAPHPVRGEAARDPGRLRLQLGIGDLGAVGDQRRPVGAALGSLGEPVVQLHRSSSAGANPGYRAHNAATPQGRTARGGALRADRVGTAASVYEDIRYEKADGIAKITIDRPEVPQRLPAADPGRAARRIRTGPRRHRGRCVSSPARDRRVLLGRRSADPWRRRLHRRRRGRPAGRSAASTSVTSRSRSGGCRSPSWRWSPATRSAAATSCIWSAT